MGSSFRPPISSIRPLSDILADSKTLVYLGLTKVDGKDCYHLAGTTNDKTYQFWIATMPLPCR